PDEAAQFKQMIDGLVGMFAMMMAQRPALARTLQTLKTEVAGGVVKVTITLTSEQLAALVKMMKEAPSGAMSPGAMMPQGP
ncbi:MAG: hypothetical protein V2A58_15390, partial [Planctomycetota bacterium]